MASTFLEAPRRGGSNSFDVPVAALAGLSVAFAAFAAPPETLAELVGLSGLPSILPAAEPPLGLNARIGIGAAGAFIMFAFAFLLLRWLDRFGGRRRVERDADGETDLEMPRLRRRDYHPDASPRPPLCAGAELGEPELILEREAAPEPEPAPRLRRAWLPDAPAAEAAPEAAAPAEPEPEPVTAPVSSARNGSIGELLERLEQGLARRRAGPPAAPAPAPAPAPVQYLAPDEPAAPADDRLQSAIDSLQRLASRQD